LESIYEAFLLRVRKSKERVNLYRFVVKLRQRRLELVAFEGSVAILVHLAKLLVREHNQAHMFELLFMDFLFSIYVKVFHDLLSVGFFGVREDKKFVDC